MERPTVLGWRPPGSGEGDRPWTYSVWYWLYRRTRFAKHKIGWHDWDPMPLGGDWCHWCGAKRRLPC